MQETCAGGRNSQSELVRVFVVVVHSGELYTSTSQLRWSDSFMHGGDISVLFVGGLRSHVLIIGYRFPKGMHSLWTMLFCFVACATVERVLDCLQLSTTRDS